MVDKNFYLGLDIGTNSVGWAVTDGSYKIRKYKGNLMWGVHLFDESHQSAERRSFRTARRRLDRRKQRIALLQEFFAPAISKTDPSFFLRIKESGLLPKDSKYRTKNIYFDGPEYTDKDYYKQYPTIHHLICELMNSKDAHDVRLVYLACAYILAHRGHFLFEVDKDHIDQIKDFPPLHEEFIDHLSTICTDIPFDSDCKALEEILRARSTITETAKALTGLWFSGKKPKSDLNSEIRFDKLISLISGGSVKLSDLFINESYKELEKDSISVSSVDFDDTLVSLRDSLTEDQWALLETLKKLNDWALLINSLGSYDYISDAKKEIYEQHKIDLADLKKICRRYLRKTDINRIFKAESEKHNYVSYIDSPKDCNPDDFCKFILKCLDKIDPSSDDIKVLNELKEKCRIGKLCPKQVTTDNRVIPYQLYYAELKKLLDNAASYLPFLNERDEYGSVAEKILSIMEFRIPYYVGPLVKKSSKDTAWIERKADGRIYPWNYKELIDLDKTEDAFIRKVTCKCTYLADEDVLPKNSLLYCKFTVLNEINNITVDGNKISVKAKQDLYTNLFMKKRRVTVKMIVSLLQSIGEMTQKQSIGGVDQNIKSSLKSYLDFQRLILKRSLNESDVEQIIERITATTDSKRLKKWLKDSYPTLADDDIQYIAKLKYQDYGRLSRKLLEEICETDSTTGEVLSKENIISRLWNTNENLMQLLGSKYKYTDRINMINSEYYSDPANHQTLSERLKQMYVPTAVRRSINRTVDIVKEIKTIIGKDPDKVFIEMARENDVSKKGKRTESRREKITDLYKTAKEITDAETLEELEHRLSSLDDGRLRSEKYYLYFMQLGKCMYTGNVIDFDKLGNDTYYNIDHIWPQSRVKDDSFENKVLVESVANGEKSDAYPIKAETREKMHGFWHSLHSKGLVSDKKYQRLTRSSSFTDEELAGFIARQLVETRQSTKATAEIIKELCPDSDLVYVKAGLAAEFRQEMNMLKCREINDLHHAKDAYLNIVMGNVYNTQFTKDPLNYIKSRKTYSLKMFKRDANGKGSGLLTHTVERSGNVAWDPAVSFDTVRRMMSKNSIRYVRYAYKRKGGLFNQMPEKKKSGLVPRKKGLDPEKYGGYNNKTASFFTLIKAKADIIIVSIDLMNHKEFLYNEDKAKKLVYESLCSFYSNKKLSKIGYEDITFPIGKRILKVNTMLELDGYRVNLCSKDSKGAYISVSSAMPLILSQEDEACIKKVESFVQKRKADKALTISPFSGINKTDNLRIYDTIIGKCKSKPFSTWPKFIEAGEKLDAGRASFESEDITTQAINLMEALYVLKTGRVGVCDLSFAGGVKDFNTVRLNSVLNMTKYKSIRIIDQSPTGLFEKKSVNLLEL